MVDPWFSYLISCAPADYLSKLKYPVLALNGTFDIQVGAKCNLSGIKSAPTRSGISILRLYQWQA